MKGGERKGSRKDLNSRYGGYWKLEKVFFNESVSTILQLVVARHVQTLPQATTRLSHHDLTSLFQGMLETSHLSRRSDPVVTVEGWWTTLESGDGACSCQFADGIDMIGIGQLQPFATRLMIGFFQATPKKRELTFNTPRNDETILGFFLHRFSLYF